jgi:hypothetical protein
METILFPNLMEFHVGDRWSNNVQQITIVGVGENTINIRVPGLFDKIDGHVGKDFLEKHIREQGMLPGKIVLWRRFYANIQN